MYNVPTSLLIRVEEGVVPAVSIAPVVTKPDIIAGISKNKTCQQITQQFLLVCFGGVATKSFCWRRHDPVSGGSQYTMLDKDDWSVNVFISIGFAVRNPV